MQGAKIKETGTDARVVCADRPTPGPIDTVTSAKISMNEPSLIQGTNLKLVSWNIRGLGDKLMDPDVQTYLFQNHIVIIYETMKYDDYFINIPGYTFHHYARRNTNPRAHRASGGIGIFISNKIKDGITIFTTNEVIVWIKICSRYFVVNEDIYIGCVYISPEGSTSLHVECRLPL